MPKNTGTYYFKEHAPGILIDREVADLIAVAKTPFQECAIWKSPSMGTCLTIDGDLQSTEMDCATYHEALVQPAALLHPNPKTALVMGGGEGATAKELLKHTGIERVVMVDIDRQFVDLCQEHIPEWGAWKDPRLEVHFKDIFKYLERNPEKFDLIIGDLTDLVEEISPGKSFHSPAFYKILQEHMNPGAILATQASALALYNYETHRTIRHNIAEAFKHAQSYHAIIDSFMVSWGFVMASEQSYKVSDMPNMFAYRLYKTKVPLKHYDPYSLAAMFCVNKELTERLK